MPRSASWTRRGGTTSWSTCRGDFPTILPAQLRAVVGPLVDPTVDIGTLVAPIESPEEAATPPW